MSRSSHPPASNQAPAWHTPKAVKLRGFNPQLAKRIEQLDANRDSLARTVERLRKFNDLREAESKTKK